MPEFRKKPVVIEAMQWDGSVESIRAICEWANDPLPPIDDPNVDYCTQAGRVVDPLCHTLEGPLNISPGDWIICGVQGEFYPCKPDIFDATYEPVPAAILADPDVTITERAVERCCTCGWTPGGREAIAKGSHHGLGCPRGVQ